MRAAGPSGLPGLRCSAGRELPRGVRAARHGVGWRPDATRRWRRCSPAVSSRAEAAQVPVHRESAGVTFLNFCWNFNRRRGALRPDAPAERSRRWMRMLASVLQAASTPPQPSNFIASVRLVGVGVLSRFIAFVQPALPATRAGAKTGPGHSPADRQRLIRRCRRGRAELYWSGVASRRRAAREPAHSRQGPRRASR